MKYLKLREAADYLGINKRKLERLTQIGEIDCDYTAGKHRRFTLKELDRYNKKRWSPEHLKARQQEIVEELKDDSDVYELTELQINNINGILGRYNMSKADVLKTREELGA